MTDRPTDQPTDRPTAAKKGAAIALNKAAVAAGEDWPTYAFQMMARAMSHLGAQLKREPARAQALGTVLAGEASRVCFCVYVCACVTDRPTDRSSTAGRVDDESSGDSRAASRGACTLLQVSEQQHGSTVTVCLQEVRAAMARNFDWNNVIAARLP